MNGSREIKVGVTAILSRLLMQKPEMFQEIEEAVHYYIAEYLRVKKQNPREPASVAYSFHRVVDKMVMETRKSTGGEQPVCKKGCSHCCYVEAQITDNEAALILEYCKTEKIPIDWEKIEFQARYEKWDQMAYKDRKCVFLDENGGCRIYLHRPMVCRKYLVGGDPEKCNSQKFPKGDVKVYSVNQAEVVASAVFSVDKPESLPKQLLKRRP